MAAATGFIGSVFGSGLLACCEVELELVVRLPEKRYLVSKCISQRANVGEQLL